ncbi:MAG: hypothetical protein HYS07_09970 [Chlamydiae bacterium]|nr:hypothetical protein [Chlamydiota bacterium]MBI3276799.1 hypothetical protein [Chlamydiota bacterium]
MKPAQKFDRQFSEVVRMIREARYHAIKSVNAELVKLYWSIGEYISRKMACAEWGDAVVDGLAEYIQTKHPDFKGFTRRGLYRMRQFYETYRDDAIVSTLLTQISWSSHLHILSKTKDDEVAEYALSRNLSPALVAEYKTKLIPKQILRKKLHEYFLLAGPEKEKTSREGGHVAGKAHAAIKKQMGKSVITGMRPHQLPEKMVKRPIRKRKAIL